jgi:hypothetical protein
MHGVLDAGHERNGMLVYGERVRQIHPALTLRRIASDWRSALAHPPGIERHGAMVSAFVGLGELAQGLADQGFAGRGFDEPDACDDGALDLLRAMAGAIERSRLGLEQAGQPDFATLAPLLRPGEVATKRAEGFAHYALYPESYAQAAANLPRDRPWVVIGLRSIGLPLAAMVAAVLDAADCVSLRPTGHPFARRLAVGPALRLRLLQREEVAFAVVDEGPGLSGSSFGAVVEWLAEEGVRTDRIHLLPSHGGAPGPQAPDRLRRLWDRLNRHPAEDHDALANAADWFPELGLRGPIREIGAGAWRAELFHDPSSWPPVDPRQERRKWLADSEDGPVLLRFAGLGPAAGPLLERGKALWQGGFAPEPLGYRHGVLALRWHAPVRMGLSAFDSRADLIARVGRYLGWRAAAFPAREEDGASLGELLAMARHNAALALGPEAAPSLDRLARDLPPLAGAVRRVVTDNKLEPWEWIALPDGTVLKTDGVDHADGHDLVGAQDPAWDIACAIEAFDLDEAETEGLCRTVERGWGYPVDRRLVAWLRPCRAAFAHGCDVLALEANRGTPEEGSLSAATARSRERLRRLLKA